MSKTIAPNLTELIDRPCDCGGVKGCQSCEARHELRALKAAVRAARRDRQARHSGAPLGHVIAAGTALDVALARLHGRK